MSAMIRRSRVLMVDVDHQQTSRLSNLGGRQTDTRGRVHGLNHALHERIEAAIDIGYFSGGLLKSRIGICTYSK